MNEEIFTPYIPTDAKIAIDGNVVSFELPLSRIVEYADDLYHTKNLPLKMITATDERVEAGCYKIWYIFGIPRENIFIVPFIRLTDTEEFPSVSSLVHEAWNYEKKINTFFGLVPVGHVDRRPLILHENWPTDLFPLRKDFMWNTRPEYAEGDYAFQTVKGEGVYEIPVGPIHAGIIEPGHFRFSVVGERIVLLEPKLGYTHKGSEKLFETLSLGDKIRLSEKISGDSSFSHSLAFCQASEQLCGIDVPQRALYLRVVYAELERLANHFGDIGAIMLDAGFNFGGAHGSRLREAVMRINERVGGSRFLRGVDTIGGVVHDISDKETAGLSGELSHILKDFHEVMAVAENSSSFVNRLKETGVLSPERARNHGVLGITARASGIPCDARVDYPYAAYDEIPLGKIATESGGDAYARFLVRVKEVNASIDIILKTLRLLPEGPSCAPVDGIVFKKNAVAVSIVEGWRGDIVYFITTDSQGAIDRVVPRDPSFVNWAILRDAGFSNVVPDFPLINKSFNLSYSGNDL